MSHIDTAGAMEIADALKVNNTLTFLDLGLNNIQHEYRRKIEKELQTKHAATHIQKIVRGHQVRIKQDTNPRTISDYLSIFIQKATNCVTKKL